MSKFPTTYRGLKWTTYAFSSTDLASYEGSINFSAIFDVYSGILTNEAFDSIRVTSTGIYYEDHCLLSSVLVTDYYPSTQTYVIKPRFRVICFTPDHLSDACRSPEAINIVPYNKRLPANAELLTSDATSNMISINCENVKYNYARSYTQAVPLDQLNRVGDFMVNFGEERPNINNLNNHVRSIKDKIFRDVKDQSGYRDEWLTPDVGITLSIDDTVSNNPANVSIKNSNDYPVRCLIKLILIDINAAYIGDEYVKTDVILPDQTIYLECSASQTVSYIIPTIAGVQFE